MDDSRTLSPTELPGGTVTFVFTDIEGSTRLERELRERYGVVLGDHRRLLREAFARHGGLEIDTQGDSFFFVFSRARDAVAAAVAGQQALAAHPWPGGQDVRVRIGMHTGEATLDDGRTSASPSIAAQESRRPAMAARSSSRARPAMSSRTTSPPTSESSTSASTA